jgi:signal transduction histidine kinase
MPAMDLKRLVLYYLVMTLFLAALAAGAYTGLRDVSAEAEDVNRRLALVVLAAPLEEKFQHLSGYRPEQRGTALANRADEFRADAAHLRTATAGGPLEAEGRNLAGLAEAVLADPADPTALGNALAASRVLRERVLSGARVALRDHADRPAALRARWIFYGSVAATFLGTLAFTLLFVRALRERRAAEERVRRAETLAALGTLAAGVAHEVNNPLGTIAACADAAGARIRSGNPDPARTAELLATIGSEARRCSRIVGDLMDFARDGEPAAGPVDLGALVKEVVDLARLNPRFRRVPIEISGLEETPLLLADAGRLKQAVLNLVANAVEVSPEVTRVEVSVTRDGSGAAVGVMDRGPGVPPAERRRIFEPFRTGKTGGTGLGLTVVDRVAASHGGSVENHDAPGGGAVFRLRLPARPSKG